MKKKNTRISAKLTYTVFIGLWLAVSAGFIIFVITDPQGEIIKGVAIFLLAILILNILFIILLRKKVVAFTSAINEIIKKIIDEEDNIGFEFNDETLLDKISVKLKRLNEIVQSNKQILEQEKKQTQENISDISHQIKTPITNLKMYNTTIIERDLTPQKSKELSILMQGQIEKLDFLTSSMIKLSRLEVGTVNLNKKPYNLYETLAVSVAAALPKAEDKNIMINVLSEEVIIIPHDTKWTAEAIFNILDNAIKYTKTGGAIDILVEKRELTTKIEITDTGKGIAEKNHANIFKRFFREEDVTAEEGVGLGLYLAREIITKQKGYIQVISAVNKGSTFRIVMQSE